MDGLDTKILMGNWLLYICFENTLCFVKSVINFEFFVYYRYLPFGINGVLGGSATVFFSYIGFDSVTAAAEEVYSTPISQNSL